MTPIPDFIIVGAKKAGTTSLYRILSLHPKLNMSVIKEPHFFTTRGSAGHWQLGLEWYESLFPLKPGKKGEASMSYARFPISVGVAKRIHDTNPQVKIIYLVRDPIARALSHYFERVIMGKERRVLSLAFRGFSPLYFLPSMYNLQLQQYSLWFETGQICVMPAEALWNNPSAHLAQIYRFLEVDYEHPPELPFARANSTVAKARYHLADSARNEAQEALWNVLPPRKATDEETAASLASKLGFSTDQKHMMRRLFASEVQLLYKNIGRSIDEWGDQYDFVPASDTDM